MNIYKASEWKSASGKWYVSNVEDLANGSGYWWIPPKIFGLSYEDYIYMLKNKYHISYIHYTVESNTLIFRWDDYENAHKYLLDINRFARQKKFTI